MLIEQGGNLLVQITTDYLNRLLELRDGVIAGWDNDGHILEDAGEVLAVEDGVTIWLGKTQDAYASDTLFNRSDGVREYETPRVWLDATSAQRWLDLAGGDTGAAVELINAHIVHDADDSDPDCDQLDAATGFTCTRAAGHDGDVHVAGVGRACMALTFDSAL